MESKDSYYSPKNQPSLTSASIFDKAWKDFSNELANKLIAEYPKGNLVEDEKDVDLLLSIFQEKIMPDLLIPDYYTFKVNAIIIELKNFMLKNYEKISIKDYESDIEEEATMNIFAKDKDDILEEFIEKNIVNSGASIDGSSLNFNEVAKNLSENFLKYSYELYRIVLDRMNEKQTLKINNYLKEALQNIKNHIIYEKITCKKTVITLENHLVEHYFTELKNGDLAANNGWILNADPRENFAVSDNFHYLRRNIVIWEDLVKLRYGNTRADSPFLWKRMKKYVQDLALNFNGFRIDNAHSTPLHVGAHFLRKAREANPNLHIIMELFGNGVDMDSKYMKILGANALVKEAHHVQNIRSLISFLIFFGLNKVHRIRTYIGYAAFLWKLP